MKQSRTLDRAYRRMQCRAGCGRSVCTGGAYDKEEEDRKDMRIEKDLLKLRAHHLLCIPQYQGNGYSEAFCSQMEAVIKALKAHEGRLVLLDEPDILCRHCPNLMRDSAQNLERGSCRCEKEAEIIRKDRTLLEGLHIEAGMPCEAEELKKKAGIFMSQELFCRACGDCEWLRRGFCNYRLWKENFYDIF